MARRSTLSRPRSALALVLSIAVPFIIGGLGALSTAGNVTGWYADANKAPWTPPNWVFGPVWSMLYTFMGVAFWLTIVEFKYVNVTAALLLIPYEAWLWIATSLNVYLALAN